MSAQPSVSFVVEEAGCESCAARVRAALDPLLRVREIAIDAASDRATVTGVALDAVSQGDVEAALTRASTRSGHRYRLAPGSWRVVS